MDDQTPQDTVKKYHIFDRKTGDRVNRTEYSSRSTANRVVDRLDNEYGGYRYYAKPVEVPSKPVSSSPVTSGGGRSGGVGSAGGGMNPMDIEKVPGKRPLKFQSGGSVSASKRADGCAVRGKTKGKMV